MEEMATQKIHPGKAPYGYIRNKDNGHLEIEYIEAEVVKEIFELCKKGYSTRSIARSMKDSNSYLKAGKWTLDRIYKILNNSTYIGIFEYGKYARKPKDILRVENYCEPIIDIITWNKTRKVLEKNKHSNYGEHIHLFTGIVKCPDCGKILSSTNSFKYSNTPKEKVYYHLTCKNPNCKSKGIHYSSDKIEEKLLKFLNELVNYMYDMEYEIITCNSNKSKDIKDIEKAIEKLKMQEKKLVDLYVNSNLDIETINYKNEVIKNEIGKLKKRIKELNPENEFKDYTIELLQKLEFKVGIDENMLKINKLENYLLWNDLDRQTKKELIQKTFFSLEISRDKNHEIEIINIKFTEEFISKNTKEYLGYLRDILKVAS